MGMAARMERTLVLLKPDCVARGLLGEVLSRFERKGFEIVGLKLVRLSRQEAEEHYAEHRGKDFYEGLVNFISSGPMVVAALEGRGAVSVVREICGATSGQEAAPGTVRGDYALSDRFNLIHASDGPESARREVSRFFRPEELIGGTGREWIYDRSGGEPL